MNAYREISRMTQSLVGLEKLLPTGNECRDDRKGHAQGKRVIIICNDADYFLRHRQTIARSLTRMGHHVRVVTGGAPIQADLHDAWSYVHTPIERFAFCVRKDTALFFCTLRECLKYQPDAVHLITLKPIVVSGLAALLGRLITRRRIRIVATLPGLGRLMSPRTQMRGFKADLVRTLVRASVRLLSTQSQVHFTFESEADQTIWLQKAAIPNGISTVVSGAGVDPTIFHPPVVKRNHRRLRVLFASRLLRSKGLDVFLEAARSFRTDTDVQFLVAGMFEPGDRDAISPQELCAAPGVTFLGNRSDMANLLRSVDLVSLPTRYGEGIPRILIEAAATGVACIASDHPGCREVVEHGISGTIISTRSTRESARGLIEAVQRYLDDRGLLTRHGEGARQRFMSGNYEERKVVGVFSRLLTSDLDDASATRACSPAG